MSQATGKIILSGEYAVVFGYPGIAVPCSVLGTATGTVPASFTVTATLAPHPALSRGERKKITVTHHGIDNEAYLHRILEEITKFTGPISGHLTIENTIPIGRGMGSSTALVIAITRAIFAATIPESSLRDIALSIEDTVNPGHSGLDFAVIWGERPVLFQKKTGTVPLPENVQIFRDTSILVYWYLMDTGAPKESTSELVAWVKQRKDEPNIATALRTIGQCTERLLTASNTESFDSTQNNLHRMTVYQVLHDHHRAQVALGIVPKPVQDLIADIEKAGGAAKVVGAGGRTGGGGMVLALCPKPAEILTITRRHRMLAKTLAKATPPPILIHLTNA